MIPASEGICVHCILVTECGEWQASSTWEKYIGKFSVTLTEMPVCDMVFKEVL